MIKTEKRSKWIFYGYVMDIWFVLSILIWIKYGYIMDKFKQKISFDFETNHQILRAISSIDVFKGK